MHANRNAIILIQTSHNTVTKTFIDYNSINNDMDDIKLCHTIVTLISHYLRLDL